MSELSDVRWMRVALEEAKAAAEEGEVPVGCIVVHNGRIVGRGHNRTEGLKDPTAHAEILALSAASSTLGSWRLAGAAVYCTVEPCLMCSGALILARPKRVVFGARDPKFGCLGSNYDIARDNRFNHRLIVKGGVCSDEAARLMLAFFRSRRASAREDRRTSEWEAMWRDGRVDEGA
ncbi:MAG: nucleoside deaminase [candidate division WOR-3 bacterium]|nr:MAG: nucleoside deaminase [candidate division WOR-3 bacterium]